MGTINVKDASGATVAVARIPDTGQAPAAESLPVVLATNQPAVAVSGPLTNAQLRADPVPVAMSAAPLPSGAATDATLSAVGAAVAAVAGHVDGLEAATGAQGDAAAAADGTGNYSLIAAAKRALLNWATLLARIPAAVTPGLLPVDTLATVGVARQLAAGAASANTALTTTARRISIHANGAAIRYAIGTGAQTASATSHYIASGERLDLDVPASAQIAVIRAGGTDGVLEVSALVYAMRLRATRLSAFSHAARRPSGPLYAFLDGIPPALAGAFSRTGLGTRIGPTGLVEFGPHNLALQSENLASAAYAAWAATVVSGATTPPAGFQSADRLVEGSGIQLRGQSFALVNGTTYTQICRAKAGTRHFLVARNQQGTRWAVINLSTGQIHDAGSGFAITVNPLNDGWWEVACKFICGATGNFEVQWGISATGTNSSISFDSYVGSGLGLYLTGWQLVVGSITTYVPTATAARYLPRIDHDPVTLAARGLLIEGQGINRARTTNNLLSTEWAVSGCTRAQAAVVAPDGSLSAVTITGSSGLDCVFFEGQGSTFAAGDVTVSFHVRKGSADFAIVSIWAGTGLNGVNAWIDLNTLAVSASSATAGHAFKSCVVKRLTNGFALVELTGTWAGGIAYPSVRMTDASGSGVYTATVGKTLIVAMPQIEAGTVATSHIQNPGSGTAVRTQDGNWDITGEPFTALWGAPTYGADLLAGAGSFASSAGWTAQTGWSISGGAATATGASSLLFYAAGIVPGKEYLVTFDVVSRSAGTIGVSFNPDAFTTTFDTVGTKSVLLRAGASANGNVSLVGSSFTGSIDNFTISEVIRERTIIVEWWDRGLTFADILIAHGSGSIVESIGLYKFANTNLQFWSRSGGVNQFSSLIGVPVVGRNRAAFSFGGGNFAVSLNGATPVLGTGNVPSPNTLRIAGDAQISGGGYQMTLTSLDSRPTALTGAALQALSAL